MKRVGDLEKVLARDCHGAALARLVLGEARGKVYVVNPALAEEALAGRAFPVGFPSEDVFGFDADLAARIESAGKANDGGRVAALWARARRR